MGTMWTSVVHRIQAGTMCVSVLQWIQVGTV